MYNLKVSALALCCLFVAMPEWAQAKAVRKAAPAAARPSAAAPAATIVSLHRSEAEVYAATLAGRFAQGTSNNELAAQAWSAAFMRKTNDSELFERAISANMAVGDIASVVRLARIAQPEARTGEAALALAVDALAQGRYAEVERLLRTQAYGPSHRVFANHLRAFALLGLGKADEAVAMSSIASGVGATDKSALMSRAIILLAAGRAEEAELLFKSALANEQSWPAGIRFYGDALIGDKKGAEAIALYEPLAKRISADSSGFALALQRAKAGQPLDASVTTKDQATIGLLTLAQGLAAEGRAGAPATLFHLVAYFNPQSSEANFVLGQQLSHDEESTRAADVLARVRPDSPDYIAARTELAWLSFEKDPAAALAMAQETFSSQPASFAAQRLLADILASSRKDREAEAAYDRLIAQTNANGLPRAETWSLYFGRGGARERLGRWPEALSDLRIAKAASPNQPNVLNYLGYSMADRGENIEEALSMLRTAVRLRPRSGAIMDSLGWALYKSGRLEEAASTLEAAAALSPTIAETPNHLGDVYWRTNRQDEARLEWSRALTLDPSPEDAAALRNKIANGLPPDLEKAAETAILAAATPLKP